jgi:squalene synthase HpnC
MPARSHPPMSRIQHTATSEPRLLHRIWTPEEAFDYCARVTYDHYENFPVASLFLPKHLRKHVTAIYAFARTADDFADEPGYTPAERLDELEKWERQLNECYRGNATHPVFVALRETIQRFDLPAELFQSLLFAFRSDVTVRRYETFGDLLSYCSHSANPVGRLILLLFNYRNESLMSLSDTICTALQLTNFWQDVSVDLQKDRIYIPLEDFSNYGYTEEELRARQFTKEFADLMAFEVERTENLFLHGEPLLSEVGRDLSFELRLTVNGGRRILNKIRKAEYDVLRNRPMLSLIDKSSLLIRSYFS